jgi:hypothetical protein
MGRVRIIEPYGENADDAAVTVAVEGRPDLGVGKSSRRVRIVEAAPEPEARHEDATSQWQGFRKGLDNAVGNLAPLYDVLSPSTAVARRLESGAVRRGVAQREAEGVRSGEIGKLIGGFAGSAPSFFLGPAAGGAVGGYAMSEGDTLQDKAIDTALGAAGGKLGQIALRGVSGAVRGVKDPAMRLLADKGVKLPPGVAIPQLKALEDRVTSLPFVGSMVTKGREGALEGWRRSAINEGLEKIGQRLPKGAAGHEAVATAQDAVSSAYDDILPKLTAKIDKRFAAGMRDVGDALKTLPESHQKQFNAILDDSFHVGQDGQMSGAALKRADSRLGLKASAYSASRDANDQQMGQAIGAVRTALQDMIERQNPDAAAYSAAKAAFRHQAVVDSAASKATEGKFSPAQLSQAARQADRSARKRVSARGEALLQKHAAAGKSLQSAIGNSFTADRQAIFNPIALSLGLVGAPIYKTLQGAARIAALPRGPAAAKVADQVERLARPGGLLAGLSLPQLAK